jgi:hypothetical protein
VETFTTFLLIFKSFFNFTFQERAFREATYHEDEVDWTSFALSLVNQVTNFVFDLHEQGFEKSSH